jgi:hypothetical protein
MLDNFVRSWNVLDDLNWIRCWAIISTKLIIPTGRFFFYNFHLHLLNDLNWNMFHDWNMLDNLIGHMSNDLDRNMNGCRNRVWGRHLFDDFDGVWLWNLNRDFPIKKNKEH